MILVKSWLTSTTMLLRIPPITTIILKILNFFAIWISMVIEEGIIKAINTQKFWSWWTQPWTQESRFAQEQKFTMEKISTLVSIVKAVHTQSTGNETNNPLDFWVCCYTSKELMLEIMWPNIHQWSFRKLEEVQMGGFYMVAVGRLAMDKSWEKTKQILLTHSVQRPPFSVSVFSLADLQAITHYLLHTCVNQDPNLLLNWSFFHRKPEEGLVQLWAMNCGLHCTRPLIELL